MMTSQYDSRTADKFVVRMPPGMRESVDRAASSVDTSMNTVFIQAVRQYLDGQQRQQLLLDALTMALNSKEELEAVTHWRGKHAQSIRERDALQQRLTAADERLDLLEGLLRRVHKSTTLTKAGDLWQQIDAALKQAVAAAPAPIDYGSLDAVQRLELCRGDKPAPVAVVLPDRPRADEEEYERMTDYEKGLLHGGIELWDKIDEVTHLNTKCPSPFKVSRYNGRCKTGLPKAEEMTSRPRC